MTITTVHAGVTASASAKLGGPLPTVSSERFCTFFGVDAATSANRAPAGSAWSAIGAGPTYNPTYARLTPATGVRTAILNTVTGYSFAGVFRAVSGGSGASARVIATNPVSVILWTFNYADGAMTLSGAPVSGTASLTVSGDPDAFKFYIAQIGGGGTTTIYNMTDGTTSTGGGTGDVSSSGANTLDFTGGISGSNTRPVDWAWGAAFIGLLTSDERTAYYNWAKGVLLHARGFTGL